MRFRMASGTRGNSFFTSWSFLSISSSFSDFSTPPSILTAKSPRIIICSTSNMIFMPTSCSKVGHPWSILTSSLPCTGCCILHPSLSHATCAPAWTRSAIGTIGWQWSLVKMVFFSGCCLSLTVPVAKWTVTSQLWFHSSIDALLRQCVAPPSMSTRWFFSSE